MELFYFIFDFIKKYKRFIIDLIKELEIQKEV